jgi:SHS2 domain-containing protein
MATRNMLFSRFIVELNNDSLNATLYGELIDIARHKPVVELKGATYTALKVAKDDSGLWVAQCVVDV